MGDIREVTADEVILMKDRSRQVIGFEKLNYALPDTGDLRFSFETIIAAAGA